MTHTPRSLVWLGFLGGEARQRQAVDPAPVFVAVPQRLRQAGNRDPNPGPAILVALLYRLGAEEPAQAEVTLRDGRTHYVSPAWLAPAATVVSLRPFAPPPARRTA
jgi:hypothetical protein